MRIAIITGASSGIGREFVKQIAKKERIEEIWVIARRENRLLELAKESDVSIVPISLDLTKKESYSALKVRLDEAKPDVRILVNAAGFGKMGNYSEVSAQDSLAMVDLNCRALMQTTLTVLPYMKKDARILQICSAASFMPLPAMNIYAASKAFTLSYSRALRWELFSRRIHVTAVCPYWVKDTEFISVAQESKNSKAVRHFPFASRAHGVVRAALRDSKINLSVSTPGPVALLLRLFAKFIPREIIIACWEGIRRL